VLQCERWGSALGKWEEYREGKGCDRRHIIIIIIIIVIITRKHDVKELHKSVIPGAAHTIRKVRTWKYKIYLTL
jgi:hypothetical protein